MKHLITSRVVTLLFLLLGCVICSQAQTITGTVRSGQSSEPLVGVTIRVLGANNGTITDAQGKYKLQGTSRGDTLQFSSIGYEDKTIIVSENAKAVNVTLIPSSSSLGQVVVIGFGTAKKADLTGSIAHVSGSEFKNQPMTQITDMLTGTVAGVNIDQGTTASGTNSFMQIRGQTSLTASNAPMIVVDGSIFEGNLSDINPLDIESIDILKDASSAAIYGSRASNGVILITTKKGKTGKPKIRFTTEIGMDEAAHAYKPYNGAQFIAYRQSVMRQWGTGFPDWYFDDPAKLPSGITLDQWRNLDANPVSNNAVEWLNRLGFFPNETQNYLNGKQINWYNKVMRKGINQTYNVSLSGATDKVNYFWSLGYTKNQGMIRGDDFNTVRTRLNLDFKIAKWLDVGMNTQLSPQSTPGVPADLGSMYTASPYGSMFDSTGAFLLYTNSYPGTPNPLINTLYQENYNTAVDLFSTLFANLKLPFGITYKISYQPHYQWSHIYDFWPSANTIEGGQTFSNGYGTRNEDWSYEWFLDNVLHWDRRFGNSNFDLTFLYSSEAHNFWTETTSNQAFAPNQNLGFHALQFGTSPSISDNDMRYTGTGMMGRLNYSLLDRYLLTLSIRKDGYSAFGQKNPTAVFPAAALAWVISDEKFFQINWINNLKLRASWGVNGNRDIGVYSSLAQVRSNMYYDGSGPVIGVQTSTLANPNLAWERTAAFNYGLDVSFLQNKISLDANYYSMKTTHLLMNRVLPAITGFSNVTTNLGQVNNHGFELTVQSSNIERKSFTWSSNLVFSLNRNEIVHLFGDYKEEQKNGKTIKVEVPDYSNNWFPGQPIDVVWNYKILGIWQESEASEAAKYGMVPGDIKSEDVNHDGKYVELDDKQFIGFTQPRYRLGLGNTFSFLNNQLTMSIFIRADLGQIAAFPAGFTVEPSEDNRTSILPPPAYWTPQNPINSYPRLLVNIAGYDGGIKMYEPNSFVRIQDFTIAYNFSNGLANKIHLDDLRVYGAIRNLYTFTKWPGWDPESENVPMPRTFTLGLTFSL